MPTPPTLISDLRLIVSKWCREYYDWREITLSDEELLEAVDWAYQYNFKLSSAENKEKFEKFLQKRKSIKYLTKKRTRDMKKGVKSDTDIILNIKDPDERFLLIRSEIYKEKAESISKKYPFYGHRTTVKAAIDRRKETHGIF